MKIALAQIDCVPAKPQVNTHRISAYIEQASAAGADLVVFPEMADTGYGREDIQTCASSWGDSHPFVQICESAKENSLHVVCGLSERVDKRIYNSLAVISNQGELLAKYRKLHLFSMEPVAEQEWLSAGDSPEVVQIGDFKFGLSICYDLRFPELFRVYADRGSEVLINCSAWPKARSAHWEILCKARAIENQTYFAAVNRAGQDGDLEFAGRSMLIDPLGSLVAAASGNEQCLLEAVIEKTNIKEARSKMGVLKDRRIPL